MASSCCRKKSWNAKRRSSLGESQRRAIPAVGGRRALCLAKGAEMAQRQNLPPGTFTALFAFSL
jgi:hypothetical protein